MGRSRAAAAFVVSYCVAGSTADHAVLSPPLTPTSNPWGECYPSFHCKHKETQGWSTECLARLQTPGKCEGQNQNPRGGAKPRS